MAGRVFFGVLVVGLSGSAAGQGISVDEYLRYLPLEYPRLTRQTEASRLFHLYGDPLAPGYRDAAPVDGIDDARHATLVALSRRFAPFVVQNTYSAPMDFTRIMRRQPAFPLHVDTWDLATGRQLVHRETLDINTLGSARCAGDATGSQPRDDASADCRLVALLDRFDPDRPSAALSRTSAVDVSTDRVTVLYFDMPGHDPKTWREAYISPVTDQLGAEFHDALKIYVHPFIAEAGAAGSEKYEFVFQYWFYYPLNDGGNNHEGDWEHINVHIAPRSRVAEPLGPDDVAAILAGRGLSDDASDDALVIRRVDYYFHHRVLTLDFARPNAYRSREDWAREVRATPREQIGVRKMWAQIRRLAYRGPEETAINTHPVAYIGADNKGLDQLLSPPGGTNQDSHGMFPFPGLYKAVGPTGSAEQIARHFDHWAWYRDPLAAAADGDRAYGPGHVTLFDDPTLLALVPDWERVLPLVRTDPSARRDWAWLVLPVRWGYPATPSPLAGLIDYADMGNTGPVGPAFNAAWNRPGAGRGFEEYAPNQLPPFFPLEPQDGFSNNLGFFNVLPLMSNLPPLDLVWRVAALPFRALLKRQDPIYYPDQGIPLRFLGLTGGVGYTTVPEKMWVTVAHLTDDNAVEVEPGARLPQPILEIAATILALDSTGAEAFDNTPVADGAWGPQVHATFHIGKRFTSSTGIRNARHVVGFDQPLVTGASYQFRGVVNWWDLSGTVRYDLMTGGLKPYLTGGYGVSWYRLEDMSSDGDPLTEPDGPWIRNLWPPTWLYGFGTELMLLQSFAPVPRGIDVGIRAEVQWLSSPTGIDLPDVFNLATLREVPSRWVRRSTNLLLAVSF